LSVSQRRAAVAIAIVAFAVGVLDVAIILASDHSTAPGLLSVLTLAAAMVSWHLCEKHFLALKRHFQYGARDSRALYDRAA
jgi:peptidoglycan/LPS O-acetylase OafA/YrhL